MHVPQGMYLVSKFIVMTVSVAHGHTRVILALCENRTEGEP